MAKGNPRGNPDIVKIGKKTQFKKGEKRAVENGRKGGKAQKDLAEFSELLKEKLGDDEGKIFDALSKRLIKMALDGNLAAIELTLKCLGQHPGDKIKATVESAGDFTLKIEVDDDGADS